MTTQTQKFLMGVVGVTWVLIGAIGLHAQDGDTSESPRFQWIERDLGNGLTLEAESYGYLWTGIAVTPENDLIVCYPTWGGPHDNHAELLQRGCDRPMPWPNWAKNQPLDDTDARDDERAFICVQALWRDDAGTLWALDPASPQFHGVVDAGPQLFSDNQSRGRHHYPDHRINDSARHDGVLVSRDSYLNDMRFMERDGWHHTFITDSGTGGLVVIGNDSRRVLANHPSTKADPDFVPIIGGRELRVGGNGDVPQVHSDGIALSPDGKWLYWQALTNKRLYRIPTRVLRDDTMPDEEIETYVEDLGETVMTDGMIFDAKGNLYFSALEHNAIMYRTPEGAMKTLVQHELIEWPDSFSISPDGKRLYFTTAQIHKTPMFSGAEEWPGADEPYRIFSVTLPE